MTPDDHDRLIQQYAEGPDALRRAFESTPPEMRDWRPAPEDWSVDEIIGHCADAEMLGAVRIRMLVADPDPRIAAMDQDEWVRLFHGANRSIDDAFAVIDSARRWTTPLLSRIPHEIRTKVGIHSEAGSYTADIWLANYGAHLQGHVEQIKANVEAWNDRNGKTP